MDAGHLAEWMAYDRIEDEAYKRAELAAKAEAGAKHHKKRGR